MRSLVYLMATAAVGIFAGAVIGHSGDQKFALAAQSPAKSASVRPESQKASKAPTPLPAATESVGAAPSSTPNSLSVLANGPSRPGDEWQIEPEFPAYLDFAVHPGEDLRDERGCLAGIAPILTEMSQQERDQLWSPQMEESLRNLLGEHPLGFEVSVGCRQTICQLTAIGAVDKIIENKAMVGKFWTSFSHNFRNDAIAEEFVTVRYFTAENPEDRSQDISGFLLTSGGEAGLAEPSYCTPTTVAN